MKLQLITTCDSQTHPGFLRMKQSVEKHGWEIEVIDSPFKFGGQLQVINKWLQGYSGEATHIVYIDAFDNICFGDEFEVLRKFEAFNCSMVISAEKACYPHPEKAIFYPEIESGWRYVNGGGWMGEINYLKTLFEHFLLPDSHDQVWLTDTYLNQQEDIKLDSECEIFQTIAFSNPDEWEKCEIAIATTLTPTTPAQIRFLNKIHQTLPVFFHGNGRTDMKWLY
jgi:hypothetical protein